MKLAQVTRFVMLPSYRIMKGVGASRSITPKTTARTEQITHRRGKDALLSNRRIVSAATKASVTIMAVLAEQNVASSQKIIRLANSRKKRGEGRRRIMMITLGEKETQKGQVVPYLQCIDWCEGAEIVN